MLTLCIFLPGKHAQSAQVLSRGLRDELAGHGAGPGSVPPLGIVQAAGRQQLPGYSKNHVDLHMDGRVARDAGSLMGMILGGGGQEGARSPALVGSKTRQAGPGDAGDMRAMAQEIEQLRKKRWSGVLLE